jgi:hypothetical protein
MAHEYQLLADPNAVLRNADGAFIPFDPANSDYQVYLQYVTDGGVPDEYVPPTPPIQLPTLMFLQRFTQPEMLLIQAAAASDPAIALGLTIGLATGTITLVGDPVVATWMASLVTASCISPTRMIAILTP